MRIFLPEHIGEVKLSQYKRYKKVLQDNPDDEVFCAIQMVSIFCNLSIESVMQLPRNEFAEIIEHLARILDQRPQLVRKFKLNGVKYGFEPNFENAKLGVYADADTLLGDDDKIELLLSVLYRPIVREAGELYEIEPYKADEEKAKLFYEVYMDVVIGAVLFFYRLNNELLKHSLRYSLRSMTEAEALQDLASGGVGTTALYELLEKSELDLMTLEMNRFTNHSHYYRT